MDFETFVKAKQAPRALIKKDKPAKKARQRGYRTNRAFSYRGFTFYVRTQGDVSEIYSNNDGKVEHQATVPAEAVVPACRELVKMGLAWRTLKKYSIPKGSRKQIIDIDDDAEDNA